MDTKNLLNATQAAEFLGLAHRTQFYPVKEKYGLKPYMRIGPVWLYYKADLKRIKMQIELENRGA